MVRHFGASSLRIVTLIVGLLVLGASAYALAGGNEEQLNVVGGLSCQPREQLVGTTSYTGLSSPQETRELAIEEYRANEWPELPQLFVEGSVEASEGGASVRSANGQAMVWVANNKGQWQVEASLVCESLARGQTREAGQ
jgi:hypothetical protein